MKENVLAVNVLYSMVETPCLEFCCILYSGYGHITLGTGAGRIFCCFYALLGIPLCLTMLGAFGKRLNKAGKTLNDKLNRGVLPPKIGQIARAVLVFVIGFGLFILIPGWIMMAVEDSWNYGTAVYYGLITLTTIGFGDVVAGTFAK